MTFRQSLIYSHGDLLVFFKRPISVVFMIAAFLVIAVEFCECKEKMGQERRRNRTVRPNIKRMGAFGFCSPFLSAGRPLSHRESEKP